MRDMRTLAKVVVMIVAAATGVRLGVAGYSAPRGHAPAASILKGARAPQSGPAGAPQSGPARAPQSGPSEGGPAAKAGVVASVSGTPDSGDRTAGGVGPGDVTVPVNAVPPVSSAGPAASVPQPASTVGPLLSETEYGSHAYRIYPGPISAEAQRALAGYRVTIRQASPTTVEVTVFDVQHEASQTATYPSNDQLYFVDEDLDDDDPVRGETNPGMGDDYFVLTDASGHVISR